MASDFLDNNTGVPTPKISQTKPLASGSDAEAVDWNLLEERLVARGSMLYTTWDSFKTRSGSFTEVELKAVDAGGITISHRGGMKYIDYEDLPGELQKALMFDSQEAREFRAGKRQPYLPSERKKAVQDRIAIVLNKRHENEVAAVQKKYQDRRLAKERMVRAKQTWEDARQTLLKMERAYYERKGQRSLGARITKQNALIEKSRVLYLNARAAYEAMPNPLIR